MDFVVAEVQQTFQVAEVFDFSNHRKTLFQFPFAAAGITFCNVVLEVFVVLAAFFRAEFYFGSFTVFRHHSNGDRQAVSTRTVALTWFAFQVVMEENSAAVAAEVTLFVLDPLGFLDDPDVLTVFTGSCDVVGLFKLLRTSQAAHKVHLVLSLDDFGCSFDGVSTLSTQKLLWRF